MRVRIATTTEHQFKRAEFTLTGAQGDFRKSRAIAIGAMVIALTLAGVFALLLMRAIMSGLSTAMNVAEQIADGHLGHRIDASRRDVRRNKRRRWKKPRRAWKK